MKPNFYFSRILSILLLCVGTAVFSQDANKKFIGDVIYEEYKKSNVDKALTKYRSLKNKNSAEYVFNEDELNRIGYQLMQNDGDLEAAGKIFKLNIDEYPNAANPHDSYADYLLEKGDKEAARKHLEKAISIAENTNDPYGKEIGRVSKAKLAKLDNKHKQLDFLVGKWDVTFNDFREGQQEMSYRSVEEYVQSGDENLIMINVYHESGRLIGKRILVYDALNDEYDMAYIDTEAPTGMFNSSLKLKHLGDDTFELSEKFQHHPDGHNKIKHEIKKKQDNTLDWVVYESEAGKEDWKKMYAMNMKNIN